MASEFHIVLKSISILMMEIAFHVSGIVIVLTAPIFVKLSQLFTFDLG